MSFSLCFCFWICAYEIGRICYICCLFTLSNSTHLSSRFVQLGLGLYTKLKANTLSLYCTSRVCSISYILCCKDLLLQLLFLLLCCSQICPCRTRSSIIRLKTFHFEPGRLSMGKVEVLRLKEFLSNSDSLTQQTSYMEHQLLSLSAWVPSMFSHCQLCKSQMHDFHSRSNHQGYTAISCNDIIVWATLFHSRSLQSLRQWGQSTVHESLPHSYMPSFFDWWTNTCMMSTCGGCSTLFQVLQHTDLCNGILDFHSQQLALCKCTKVGRVLRLVYGWRLLSRWHSFHLDVGCLNSILYPRPGCGSYELFNLPIHWTIWSATFRSPFPTICQLPAFQSTIFKSLDARHNA